MKSLSRSYQRNSMSPKRQYEYRRRSRSPLPQRRNRSPSRSVSRSRYDRYTRRRRDVSHSGDENHGIRRRPEAPPKTRCLGVFGLSGMTTEDTIHDIFSHYGEIERINIVYDSHTGRSRGFCFIYYNHLSDAMDAKEACSGMEIDSRRIRVDYSITQRPHTPTPGIYKGNGRDRERERERTERTERGERDRSLRRSRRTRSPSPPRRPRRRHRSPASRSP